MSNFLKFGVIVIIITPNFFHNHTQFGVIMEKTTPYSVQKCPTTRNAGRHRRCAPKVRAQAFRVVGHFCTEYGVVFPIITPYSRTSWLTVKWCDYGKIMCDYKIYHTIFQNFLKYCVINFIITQNFFFITQNFV